MGKLLYLMFLVFIAPTLLELIIKLIKKKRKNKYKNIKQNENAETIYPYHRIDLLTQNEYNFYKRLKELINKTDLQILTKIRLADLVDVNKEVPQSEWNTFFNKIKSKHIDFAIAKDMKIIMLIELDDSTHSQADREKRDIFVENVLKTANYLLVRTYGDTKIIENELSKLHHQAL